MRRLLLLAVVALFAVSIRAQRSGIPPLGTPIPPLAPIPAMGTTGLSVPGNNSLSIPPSAVCCSLFLTHRPFFPRSNFFGFFPPFFGGFFSPETVLVPVPSEAPPTPQVVETGPPPEPIEPLLIEREGDRFVRYGGARAGTQPVGHRAVKSLADYRPSAQPVRVATEIHPVILVFRDGRRQEIAHYTISDSVLYAYVAGQTVPIRLAELDLPVTLELNRRRGVEFLLPAAQNEIVISF